MAVTTYLQELINQKKALANNLVEKGIEANESEKFNTLVPKVLTIPTNIGLPIEVSSEEEMTEFLTSGEVGGIYKYIGETTETYENGSLYVLKGTEESDPLLGTWTLNPQDFDMSMIDSSLNSQGWNISATALDGDEVITVSLDYLILNNVGFGYSQSSNGAGVGFPGEYPNILTLPYEYIISNAENNRWAEFSTFTINSVPDIAETNLSKILAFLQANATKQSTKQLSKEFVKLVIPTGTLDITTNAVYDVANYANVNVNVNAEDSPIPIEVSTEAEMDELLVNGELNGVYKYVGESGTYEKDTLYIRVEPALETSDGYYVVDSEGSIISLRVAEFIKLILKTDLEEITITENGEYEGEYSKVTVDVEPTLEEITITENGEYLPSGDGYSKVTVDVESGGTIGYAAKPAAATFQVKSTKINIIGGNN